MAASWSGTAKWRLTASSSDFWADDCMGLVTAMLCSYGARFCLVSTISPQTPESHGLAGRTGVSLARNIARLASYLVTNEKRFMPTFEIFSREPDIRSFRSGEPIFKEGDPGDCLFVIIEGTVEIHANGAVVDRLGAGGIFGEMGLIDSRPRSAAAIATNDCKLAAIGEKRFLRLVEQTPRFALQIMRVMSERLRRNSGH